MPRVLIRGARQVLTLRGACAPRRGFDLRNLSIIEDGSLLIEDGRITEIGPTRRIENLRNARSAIEVRAKGRVVMPGFVDCGTRLWSDSAASGGPKEIDFEGSAGGRGYGAQDVTLLRRCLQYGTTTMEARAGQGVDPKVGVKLLRSVGELNRAQPVDLIRTYGGAAMQPRGDFNAPAGAAEDPLEAYVKELSSEIIPAIRRQVLARHVLVACDPSLFDERQFRRLLEAVTGQSLGLKVRLGLAGSGQGFALAIESNAMTIESLERLLPDEIRRLGGSETIAVLTPGDGFHRMERGYAPARELITSGAAVALASGYDRESCPSFSIPMTIALACRWLKMAPSEAILAATINAAHAVGQGAVTGSIEPGKRADLLILETSDFRDLAFETGANPVETVLVRGEVVCRNSVSYGPGTAAVAAAG